MLTTPSWRCHVHHLPGKQQKSHIEFPVTVTLSPVCPWSLGTLPSQGPMLFFCPSPGFPVILSPWNLESPQVHHISSQGLF